MAFGSTRDVNIAINAKDNASGVFEKLGKGASSSLKTLGKAAGIASIALGGIGAMMVKEFSDAQVQSQKLQKLILNQAKGTMKQVKALEDQAEAMQKVGVVSKDAVTAAQAQLATFDLSSDAIRKVIPAFLDMAVAEKGMNIQTEDMKDMANGLGKALQGNTELFTKQGFVITDAQKRMLEHGTEMQRVNTIAEVLGSTYNGMNAEMRKTFQGTMIAAKFIISDFGQALGEVIAKFLSPIIQGFIKWEQKTNFTEKAVKSLTKVVEKITDFLGKLNYAFGFVWRTLDNYLQPIFADITNAVKYLTGKLGELSGFIAQTFLRNLALLWEAIHLKINPAWDAFKEALARARDAMSSVWDFIQASFAPALSDLWDAIYNHLIPAFKDFWSIHGPELKAILDEILPVVQALASAILNGVVLGIQTLINWTTQLVLWFANLLGGTDNLTTSFNNVKDAVQRAYDKFKEIWDIVYNSLVYAFSDLWTKVKDLWTEMNRLYNSISGGKPSLIDILKTAAIIIGYVLWEAVLDITFALGVLVKTLTDILKGFNDMVAAKKSIEDFFTSIANKIGISNEKLSTFNRIVEGISTLGLSEIFRKATPPSYQSGGVIPGRPGQAVPIIAHGGEVVTNPALGQTTNNNNYGINVSLNTDAAAYMFFQQLNMKEQQAKFGVTNG